MSNPPIREEGGNPGHRVRLSPDERGYTCCALRSARRGKHTHFFIQPAANDSEIDTVLGMIAGESSESTRLESGSGAPERSSGGGKKIGNSEVA